MHKSHQYQMLDLSYNRIQDLPDDLNRLSILRELYVNENKLLKLPENLNELINLKRIDFEGNKIKNLPLNMVDIQQLEMIGYKNNKGLKISKMEKKFLKKRKFNFQ